MKTNIAQVWAIAISLALGATAKAGSFADEVIAYTAGSTPAAGYTNPAAALGAPTSTEFGSAITPFNPVFMNTNMVSIGSGGQLTLRLSNYALTSMPGLQLGVFTGAGIADQNYPLGQADNPLVASSGFGNTFGIYSAKIEVSADDQTWISLGTTQFDIPTNAYQDLPGPYGSPPATPADLGQPFAGSLSSFNGENYAQMLTTLNGSGGGKWFDLSGTGLTEVGYVRFSTPAPSYFNLDAISVGNGFVGAPTPEPASIVLAAIGLLGVVILAGRRKATPQRKAVSTAAATTLFFC